MAKKKSAEKKQEDTISQILSELSDVPENTEEMNFRDSVLNTDSSDETSEYGHQYDERNRLYTYMLKDHIKSYGEKADANMKYKRWFFGITMAMMVFCVVVPVIALLIMAITSVNICDSAATVIGCVASIVSALIILPKIIAEHLFPLKEDENMIGLIKEMQKNDSEIRRNHTTHKQYKKQQKKDSDQTENKN